MRLGLNEIMEISKPRIVVLLVITAVTSMYGASKLVPGTPELDYWAYLHIIIAGALASAGSSALNHYYDKDIDPKMERTSKRPIPSGRMAASHVLIYGLAVSCISVIYGYFALNPVSAFFIAVGIILLCDNLYSLAKTTKHLKHCNWRNCRQRCCMGWLGSGNWKYGLTWIS